MRILAGKHTLSERSTASPRRRVSAAAQAGGAGDALWYKGAVIYELHVRSFSDSSGDGIGDFNGLVSKLDYLADLGVTAIWLLPFYPSPLKDDGYDIADFLDVNPSYGTLRDVQRFIDEAHRRNLRVITELIVNHTSDQHAWFQRARKAPPGSPEREFYVWSDTPDRYSQTRIIFKDFEHSNWTWDPVAKQYFWHRFYSHQPDLNFDNPAVHDAVLKACDHWFKAGVDGMRLDAIPYLYERENTNCENLPETHEFLRKIRAHVDKRFPGRMLLAEANQWPEDAIAYFGQGDECHMAFHFPLMPRLFMALRMEDRFPITDILEQTPPIPETCQWALFLRNHDELTLEMVTDEERDYMYRVYASDREARINLGIRRRLAPLLNNNRRKIELMNALLFSLPGTPVIYYGDEIGMGDNVYLGDRDGVRTPMQWSADRNAGFSRGSPHRLFLPVITEPEYNYETVNVESQQANASSLLWWMKRLIALRKQHPVFGSGQIEFLNPTNPKVLAFMRSSEQDSVLVVANLSRFAQPTHIDLARYQGQVPVEMFGQTAFTPITEHPYFLTMGPHSFFWFMLRPAPDQAGVAAAPGRVGGMGTVEPSLPTVVCDRDPSVWLTSRDSWPALTRVVSTDIRHRRWFASKAGVLRSIEIIDAVPVRSTVNGKRVVGTVLLVNVNFADQEHEIYAVPVAACRAEDTPKVLGERTRAAMAILKDPDEREWTLYDAMGAPHMPKALLESLAKGKSHEGIAGRIVTSRSRSLPSAAAVQALDARILGVEQSNSSVAFDEQFILKMYRRLEAGVNPDLEISRHLTQRVGFANTPLMAGSVEYQQHGRNIDSHTLGIVQAFVRHQCDAWTYVVDQFKQFYEQALVQQTSPEEPSLLIPSNFSPLIASETPTPQPWKDALGEFCDAVELLGQRTAEMHAALADDRGDPAFTPEPYSLLYQRSLVQSMRNVVRRSLQSIHRTLHRLPDETRRQAEDIVAREAQAIAFLRKFGEGGHAAWRIRCHGDYHLGQVLWTGKDFMIIDFEGEPLRSIGERRLKRSPLRDVAGMIRSFQYAAATGMRQIPGDGASPTEQSQDLSGAWQAFVAGAFLRSYAAAIQEVAPRLAIDSQSMHAVLNLWMLEKALYEVRYELNSRPDWADIPMQAVRDLLDEA